MSQHQSQNINDLTNCHESDSHRACVRCKIVCDGMEKHGLADIVERLQCLYDEVMNIERIDQAKKTDIGEIIASTMKQLAHTGRIEGIVLKLFDNQMTEFLRGHADILKSWVYVKDRL